MRHLLPMSLSMLVATSTLGSEPASLEVWPGFPPGESERNTGELQPPRPGETPPVSRVINIRTPTLDVFPAARGNGVGILILPGGGFAKVVPDKEGSEAAHWLNRHGITAFVLRYRTKRPGEAQPWRAPLQDAQRAMKLIRSRAGTWNLDRDRIGLLGFSAGGNVAARLLTDSGHGAYVIQTEHDSVETISHRPDFALLIYPWNIYDEEADELLPAIQVTNKVPPTFLVHTHDDRSSSLGSVLFYAELRRLEVPAELHIYRNGGHGYGMRTVHGSEIGTWPDRATEWLVGRGLVKR